MTKYPLKELARVKEKKLNDAEKQLKEKKELLSREEKKLKTLEEKRDEVAEHQALKLKQLRGAMDTGESPHKLIEMRHYLKTVDEKLAMHQQKVNEQLKQVRNAENQVEAARMLFLKRQREVEKLKIHRKMWEKEMRKEEARKEELVVDELSSSAHVRKKRTRKHHG